MDVTTLIAESMAGADDVALRRWAGCGAMWLTGRPGGPPDGSLARVALAMDALAGCLAKLSERCGRRVELSGASLLGERAAVTGLSRRGTVSCGGATRLLPTADAWLALSLARDSDVELLAAWLEERVPTTGGVPVSDATWDLVAAVVSARSSGALIDRAAVIGLPCASLGEMRAEAPVVRIVDQGAADRGPRRVEELVVVDLSSLWAGPLCGQLLALAGARVIKVESTTRPDGARHGPPAFFDLLNAGKESVALDLGTSDGTRQLAALVRRADVLIEASRPRALAHMGITPDGAERCPEVWVSITGFGRSAAGAGRVAFGDDAAVAGGLVAYDGDLPVFCGDAVADPAAGLLAAVAALDMIDRGCVGVLDVSLARTAAHLAAGVNGNATVTVDPTIEALPPVARRATGRAPGLGEHTAKVLAEFGCPRC